VAHLGGSTRFSGVTQKPKYESIDYAKSSAGWSTYLTGMEIDFEIFKDEVRRASDYVRMKKAA
jgi:hypothetical protein